MHHIYHTHAVILHTRAVGERDMFLSLFTHEFGALSVKVTGVRTIKSKLRGALVAGSWIRADIVRGREIWRLTSATADTSFFILPSAARAAYARGLRLIGRLCRGEEAHEAIYDDVRIFSVYSQLVSRKTIRVLKDSLHFVFFIISDTGVNRICTSHI